MNCFRLTTLTVMQCAAASQSPVNHCALVLLRDLGRQRVNASTATHLSPSVDSSFVLRHGPISNSSASPSYRTPRRDISVLYLGPYFAHRVSTSMCLRLARSRFLISPLCLSLASLRLTAHIHFSPYTTFGRPCLCLWDLFRPMPAIGSGYDCWNAHARRAF